MRRVDQSELAMLVSLLHCAEQRRLDKAASNEDRVRQEHPISTTNAPCSSEESSG